MVYLIAKCTCFPLSFGKGKWPGLQEWGWGMRGRPSLSKRVIVFVRKEVRAPSRSLELGNPFETIKCSLRLQKEKKAQLYRLKFSWYLLAVDSCHYNFVISIII